jgi:hypothetical protein
MRARMGALHTYACICTHACARRQRAACAPRAVPRAGGGTAHPARQPRGEPVGAAGLERSRVGGARCARAGCYVGQGQVWMHGHMVHDTPRLLRQRGAAGRALQVPAGLRPGGRGGASAVRRRCSECQQPECSSTAAAGGTGVRQQQSPDTCPPACLPACLHCTRVRSRALARSASASSRAPWLPICLSTYLPACLCARAQSVRGGPGGLRQHGQGLPEGAAAGRGPRSAGIMYEYTRAAGSRSGVAWQV